MNVVLEVLDAVINTLCPAVMIAAAVKLILQIVRRINAAIRYAIWWVTLATVLILAFAPRIVLPAHPQYQADPLVRHDVTALTVPTPATEPAFLRVSPAPAALWPRIALLVWTAILLLSDQVRRLVEQDMPEFCV